MRQVIVWYDTRSRFSLPCAIQHRS